jgi:SNF2 family DNA or RNA helicase
MKIYSDLAKTCVIFEPEGSKELSKLHKFPGLLPRGSFLSCKYDQRLVQNLYSRIKTRFKKISFSADIKEMVQTKIKILDLPSDFTFFTNPERHQLIALRFAYTFRNLGLLLEPGMGKTKVVLDFIFLMKFVKSLVICPVTLKGVWVEEALKHRPELKVYVIETTNWEQELPGILQADLVVINYDKAVILEGPLSKIQWQFMGVDEALIKNIKTSRTESILRLSRIFSLESKMIMSGTLVNNSPLDIYAPVKFLELEIVGNYYSHFKNEYTVQVNQKDSKAPKIVVGYRNIEEVRDILASVSVVMTKEEWLDLPAKKFHDIQVSMASDQKDLYEALASNYMCTLADGSIVEVDNPLSLLSKLNQISNGFIYYKESESDTKSLLADLFGQPGKVKDDRPRKTQVFSGQPKAEAMVKLLTEGLKTERVVLWFNLRAELAIIKEYLDKAGITYEVIAGGEKDAAGKVADFNKNKTVKVLICQAKSINYGVTITGHQEEEILPGFSSDVCNMVFYSINFSLEVYLQQQDRIHRMSQKRECHYWRILSDSPVEYRVLERLDQKLVCNKAILVDIVESLR